MVQEFTKDPDAILDYQIDWSRWLETGEAITASTWIVTAGLTLDSSSNTTSTAVAWLSGGESGSRYRATNRITTSNGRTDDRSIIIKVKER